MVCGENEACFIRTKKVRQLDKYTKGNYGGKKEAILKTQTLWEIEIEKARRLNSFSANSLNWVFHNFIASLPLPHPKTSHTNTHLDFANSFDSASSAMILVIDDEAKIAKANRKKQIKTLIAIANNTII